jgi:hypothetical protein
VESLIRARARKRWRKLLTKLHSSLVLQLRIFNLFVMELLDTIIRSPFAITTLRHKYAGDYLRQTLKTPNECERNIAGILALCPIRQCLRHMAIISNSKEICQDLAMDRSRRYKSMTEYKKEGISLSIQAPLG